MGDRLVKGKHPVLHQQRYDQVRGALARGVDTGQRIARHLLAGPQVDHLPTVHIRRELRAWLAPFLGHNRGELLPHLLKAFCNSSLHMDLAQRLRSLMIAGTCSSITRRTASVSWI